MFFIVWGRKGITKKTGSGSMNCPLCKATTDYELKTLRKYFTLFWIPLFPYGESIHYLECQQCKTPFNPEYFGFRNEDNGECQ